MNYLKHYNKLIQKAKNRVLSDTMEKHHIIPKCMGGCNEKENLVNLTPEEHYVAHQLLLKMYPKEPGLIYAAVMMTMNRSNNKVYGWLRRKHADAVSINQTGTGNSQYGTCWISNIEQRICKKIQKEELELYLSAGWEKKRIQNWDLLTNKCFECQNVFTVTNKSKFCSSHCKNISRKNQKKRFPKISDEEIKNALNNNETIPVTLKSLGLSVGGGNYKRAKSLSSSNGRASV